jgi:hypothetical protein
MVIGNEYFYQNTPFLGSGENAAGFLCIKNRKNAGAAMQSQCEFFSGM